MTNTASNVADKTINASNTNELTGSNDSVATSNSDIGEVHGESTLGNQSSSGYADNSVKDVLLVVSPEVTKGDRNYVGSNAVGMSSMGMLAILSVAVASVIILKRRRASSWEY